MTPLPQAQPRSCWPSRRPAASPSAPDGPTPEQRRSRGWGFRPVGQRLFFYQVSKAGQEHGKVQAAKPPWREELNSASPGHRPAPGAALPGPPTPPGHAPVQAPPKLRDPSGRALSDQKGATLKHKVYVRKFTWRRHFRSEALFGCLLSGSRHPVFPPKTPHPADLIASSARWPAALTSFTLLHTLNSIKLCFFKCMFTP